MSVGGEIDVYTAPKLRDNHRERRGRLLHIVIDMEAESSSTPPGSGSSWATEEGPRPRRVTPACNQDPLLDPITGLAKVFVIHESAGRRYWP